MAKQKIMSYLPHIYPIGATFFITFRLADSLPQHKVRKLKTEFIQGKEAILKKNLPKQMEEKNIYNLRRKIFGLFDKQLDEAPYGECCMNDPKVAQIIWDKIFQYHGLYYEVHSISIMPNHVHMLLDTSIQVPIETEINETPIGYENLNKWMKLIKGGSAYSINKHLGRKGKLWEKESYDHYLRFDEDREYSRIKDYIEENPIKARLDRRFLGVPYYFKL